jgi:hypothetical protein
VGSVLLLGMIMRGPLRMALVRWGPARLRARRS